MTIQANPIYDKIFNHQAPVRDLLQEDEAYLTSPKEIDFSLTEKSWKDTAKVVCLFLIKIVLFPWGVYEMIRWGCQRSVMRILYPAQSWAEKKYVSPWLQTEALDNWRLARSRQLLDDGFIVRHVILEKDGAQASGFLIGKPDTIKNGKWVLQAVSGSEAIEGLLGQKFAREYQDIGFNTLLINNPGLGRSEGFSSPESIGDFQRMGIRFLETALNANKLVLAGFSFGAAAIGQIFAGNYKPETQNCLVVRQLPFGKASRFMAHINNNSEFVSNLTRWTGCEMDNVESSKKLTEFAIPEVIIQIIDDESVPFEISLEHDLNEEGIGENEGKKFHHIDPIDNNMDIDQVVATTVEAIRTWEEGN